MAVSNIPLADAIKRILAADDGQLAERLDAYFQSQLGGTGIFQAVCGVTLPELIEQTGAVGPVKKNT